MKNLVLVLFVTLSSVVFSQPDLDSLNKLPFYHCPITFNNLKSFHLKKMKKSDFKSFSELLSERYGCYVWCEDFIDMYGFKDVELLLSPSESEVGECSITNITLSVAENLYRRGILLENVNLYYEICKTTSEN